MCVCVNVCVGARALEHVFVSKLRKISIKQPLYNHIYAHLKLVCPSIVSLTVTMAGMLLYSYFEIPSYVSFNQSV